MKEDLISIIVPVYNAEKYLNRCINSIINQTYTNIEIILVDDESPDNSPKICDEWSKKDSRIKVIHKKNGGPASARNSGLKEAKGKYIGFVDSDDYIESEMYEKLYNSIKTNKSNIAVCNYVKEYRNKKIHNKTIESFICEGKRNSLKFLTKKQVGWTNWNKIYDVNSIKEKDIFFNQSLHIGEDGLFNFDIIDSCDNFKISYIGDELYHYIIADATEDNKKYNSKKNDCFVFLEKYIDIFEKNNINADTWKIDYICKYNKYAYLKSKKKMKMDIEFETIIRKNKEYCNSIELKSIGLKKRVKLFLAKHLPSLYSKIAD